MTPARHRQFGSSLVRMRSLRRRRSPGWFCLRERRDRRSEVRHSRRRSNRAMCTSVIFFCIPHEGGSGPWIPLSPAGRTICRAECRIEGSTLAAFCRRNSSGVRELAADVELLQRHSLPRINGEIG